jgi:MoaA/NifB/PqqE/SkfB family radical SAM enzyme
VVNHALALGLKVECFSNLVHVSDQWWELFQREGVKVATSYYSDRAKQHNAMTGRPSHARTRANIEKAVRLGVPLRVGIIGDDQQAIDAARLDLEALGVTRIGEDRVRPFGRGAQDQDPDPANLCGQCGTGRAAIGPDGAVSPCIMSGWMGVGNVRDSSLDAILGGTAMAEASASIRNATSNRNCAPHNQPCQPVINPPSPESSRSCYPDSAPCAPDNAPPQPCGPDDGTNPPSECEPRGG